MVECTPTAEPDTVIACPGVHERFRRVVVTDRVELIEQSRTLAPRFDVDSGPAMAVFALRWSCTSSKPGS